MCDFLLKLNSSKGEKIFFFEKIMNSICHPQQKLQECSGRRKIQRSQGTGRVKCLMGNDP